MKKILLTTAAFVLAASTAFAKESGDSYYVKGSLGLAHGKDKISLKSEKSTSVLKNTTSYNATTKGSNLIGGIGAGMAFSNGFRSELEFLINDGSKKGSATDKLKIKVDNKTYATFLNAYFDFKNSSNITPFVNAGLGWAHTKHSAKFGFDGTPNKIKFKSKNSLAYKIGAGVAFKASKNVTLDVSYAYMNTGAKFSYNKDNISYKYKTSGTHAIMTGVRFAF